MPRAPLEIWIVLLSKFSVTQGSSGEESGTANRKTQCTSNSAPDISRIAKVRAIPTVILSASEGPMYLRAQLHRSFASLKMTVHLYVMILLATHSAGFLPAVRRPSPPMELSRRYAGEVLQLPQMIEVMSGSCFDQRSKNHFATLGMHYDFRHLLRGQRSNQHQIPVSQHGKSLQRQMGIV